MGTRIRRMNNMLHSERSETCNCEERLNRKLLTELTDRRVKDRAIDLLANGHLFENRKECRFNSLGH